LDVVVLALILVSRLVDLVDVYLRFVWHTVAAL
jgi:hypothetical protein